MQIQGTNLFSRDQLSRILDETIPASVSLDDNNAMVAAVTETGASVALHVTKLTDKGRWTVEGAYKYDLTHPEAPNSVGARVIFSWKN
jgi:hypothetical protein